MSTSSARFEHEIRPFGSSANLQDGPSDKECFQAIDTWVREKEREWVALARACMEIQTRELWKHGGFHSYDDWLHNAAPSSARTIYWHISLLRGLESDFTDEEMAQMPPESAKVVRGLSTKARRDPVVREAATRKRKALVATVRKNHPDQLVEDETMVAFSVTESQRGIIDEEFEFWEKEDPEMSRGEILVALCLAAGEIRKSGRSV